MTSIGPSTWLRRLPYRMFGRLPRRVRRRIARTLNTRFTVGATIVLVEDGNILLVRHSYRRDWSTPGGFVAKHEQPVDAAIRETREELGLDVVALDGGACKIHGRPHLDIAFMVRRADPTQQPEPQGPEIDAVQWWPLDALPRLDPECLDVLRTVGALR